MHNYNIINRNISNNMENKSPLISELISLTLFLGVGRSAVSVKL